MNAMTHISSRRRRALATAFMGLALGGSLIAIEVWRGAPVQRAIGGLAILLAFAAVILIFQTRSETVSTLAGDPVDERWRLISVGYLAGVGWYRWHL